MYFLFVLDIVDFVWWVVSISLHLLFVCIIMMNKTLHGYFNEMVKRIWLYSHPFSIAENDVEKIQFVFEDIRNQIREYLLSLTVTKRRTFLKLMGLWIWATLVPNVASSQDPIHSDSTEITDHKDQVQHHEHEQHHEESLIQAAVDLIMTWIFAQFVAPKFMDNKVAEAFEISIVSSLGYVSASSLISWLWWNSHATEHRFTEMIGRWGNLDEKWDAITLWKHKENILWSSWAWTLIIVWVLQASQFMKLDVVWWLNDYLNSKRKHEYKALYDDPVVKQKCEKLWIKVDPSKSTSMISINLINNVIEIGYDDYEKILPYILNNDIWKVSSVLWDNFDTEKKSITQILEHNSKWSDEQVSVDTKNKLLSVEVALRKEKINFLTSYILWSQLIFGVWQASLLKKLIRQDILPELKSMLMSCDVNEEDAIRLAMQCEAKLVSFWFNRFAYFSDIGPLVACGQLAWVNGVKWMVKGMLGNIAWEVPALNNELWDLLAPIGMYAKEMTVDKDGLSIFANNRSNAMDAYSWINAKTIVSAFRDTLSWWPKLISWKIHRMWNEAYVNKKIRDHIEHRHSKDVKTNSDYEIINAYQALDDKEWLLDDISNQLSDPSISYKKKPFLVWDKAFDQIELFTLLYYIYWETDNKGKQKINTIINADTIVRDTIIQWLEIHHHDTLQHFLEDQLNLSNYTHSVYNEAYFDEVLKNLDPTIPDKEKINALHANGLWLSIDPTTSIFMWSREAKLKLIEKNLEFIFYAETKNNENLDTLKTNFSNNIKNLKLSPTKIKKWIDMKYHELFDKLSWPIDEKEWVEEEKSGIEKWLEYVKRKIWDLVWLLDLFSKSSWVNPSSQERKSITSIKDFIHRWESRFGKSSFEVICMIFFIQAPFVPPIVSTVKRIVSVIPDSLPKVIKKYIIGFVTYFMSAFADNYVATKIWFALMKQYFPELSDESILEFIAPNAIIWGSNAITWNAPNAVINTYIAIYTNSHNPDLTTEQTWESKRYMRFFAEMLFDSIWTWLSSWSEWVWWMLAWIISKLSKKHLSEKLAQISWSQAYYK